MLTHLQIRDFAIIEHLELDLAPGMTAMTGETGAGKSIMIDAIGLLLGDRADSATVRFGAERAEISAMFELHKVTAARAWLAERDLDLERDCHLRRIITREGRSRAYINGTPQPLQALKDLGDLLVDIHGQHQHQSLLKREAQRQLVDDHADNQALLTELAGYFQTWNRLRQRLETLQQTGAEREARLDLLRYQVRELEALNLREGELAELEAEHRRLANAGRLLETSQRTLSWLYEHEELSAHSLLSQSINELQALDTLDARLTPVSDLLNAALIQVKEASNELRHYVQRVDLDPERLNWVEQRLVAIHALSRKHRRPATELPALLERLKAELDEMDNSSLHHQHLEQELAQSLHAYSQCAKLLSTRRAAAAADLGTRVSAAMQTLGMPGGRLTITLEPYAKPSLSGLEAVEFLVSANPGQPLRPLTKVVSGGELSRISLAIQVIAAHSARIPTLIFDEVDTGIGGGIAEVVGRQLRTLGKTRQVLCVTHLPQVAAQAHQHLQISKQVGEHTTRTTVIALGTAKKIEEIARMLGGLELTNNTLAHAQEMIERAQGCTKPAS